MNWYKYVRLDFFLLLTSVIIPNCLRPSNINNLCKSWFTSSSHFAIVPVQAKVVLSTFYVLELKTVLWNHNWFHQTTQVTASFCSRIIKRRRLWLSSIYINVDNATIAWKRVILHNYHLFQNKFRAVHLYKYPCL